MHKAGWFMGNVVEERTRYHEAADRVREGRPQHMDEAILERFDMLIAPDLFRPMKALRHIYSLNASDRARR